MTLVEARPVVGVDELKRAWRAVQEGRFRAAGHTRRPTGDASETLPGGGIVAGPVLPVVGCVGSSGASTVALALALATAAGAARVIECCTVTASGLAAASTAELGRTGSGWARGRRGRVLIERTDEMLAGPGEVPDPLVAESASAWTFLDVGWELGQVLGAPGWLGGQVRSATTVVAVTSPTAAGMRRLEGALALLSGTRVVATVVGPPRRRWPGGLEHAIGVLGREVDRRGDLLVLPRDKRLAVRGLDSTPLPASLLSSAAALLCLVDGPATTIEKGTSR